MAALALADHMIDAHASCVVVVVDVHTALWSLRESFGTTNFLKLEDMLSLVSVYCNTVAIMHRRNKVYVIFHGHNVGTYEDVISSLSVSCAFKSLTGQFHIVFFLFSS